LFDSKYKQNYISGLGLDNHLKNWLVEHGSDSLDKFAELEKSGFKKPLLFTRNSRNLNCQTKRNQSLFSPYRFQIQGADNVVFQAYIDPENKFNEYEKFSQVHVLEQLKNLNTYSFLAEKFRNRAFQAHAMWFDVDNGDVYMFSFDDKRFLKIDESTYAK
jgi:hypothetical protein